MSISLEADGDIQRLVREDVYPREWLLVRDQIGHQEFLWTPLDDSNWLFFGEKML
jgi:hypothetical protein